MSNMKYYTNIVPTHLYSKLLEKGMPVNLVTYAEVFDWLITMGVSIIIHPDGYTYDGNNVWRYTCYGERNYVAANANGWIKTANDAINATIEQLI